MTAIAQRLADLRRARLKVTDNGDRIIRVLSLGAGVQSTVVDLMSRAGQLPEFDASIFADTGEEPRAVYEHLQWLCKQPGHPILIRGVGGRLGDHLKEGRNSKGGRFASIPAFTAKHHDAREVLDGCNYGRVRRQCTKEYKVDVVERTIRRELLHLAPGKHVPKNVRIYSYMGLSYDEQGRAERVQKRFDELKLWECVFPLIEMKMTRQDCIEWLKGRVPHPVPRSACVFCPYKTYAEWKRLRDEDPEGWARAVEIDNAMRQPGAVINRKMDESLYLVRKCIPLELVDLDAEAEKKEGKNIMGIVECEGMCGS